VRPAGAEVLIIGWCRPPLDASAPSVPSAPSAPETDEPKLLAAGTPPAHRVLFEDLDRVA
jgi:hypothetical protein